MADSTLTWAKWPSYDDEQIEAVVKAMRAGEVNYWNGQVGRQFERDYAKWVGANYGMAVANGSVALDLILEGLDIGPGHDVVVTSRSFAASVHCIVRRGARPVFADIDRDSQNITVESIRAVLTPKTRAIITVHLAGWPCDMHGINALANEHGLYVIEDCAQAHGAKIGGQSVGTFGDAAAFSFCTDKIMTTGGEGGVVTVNDADLYERLWSIKDHGKNRAKTEEKNTSGVFKWLIDDIGTNYRMPELQAAIAAVQLRRVDGWVETRRSHAAILNAGFADTPGLRLTLPGDDIYHAYYKHYAFVEPEHLRDGWSRDRIVREVIDRGVPCGSGSCSEIYNEQAYQSRGLAPDKPLPVAAELGQTSLMFQVHPTLDERHMAQTVEVVNDVMTEACGQRLTA